MVSGPCHPASDPFEVSGRNETMRIGFVITELFIGGAERCLTELALGLADRCEQVRVFSLGTLPSGQQRALVDRLEAANIRVDSAEADSAFKTISAYRRLGSWYQDLRPDVSQTFLHHANVIGSLAGKAARVPRRVAGVRVAQNRPLGCRLERMALRAAHSTVCVSDAVRQYAHNRLGCHSSVVIPNGVDVDRFALATPFDWQTIGWPEDSVVSLFVGRLHAQKGLDLLQQHIDSIAPQGSNRRLLLVGDGPLRREIVPWIDTVGSDRVQLLPWQADVAPLMRACRLLILPSRYEGMPNVVLEAMAAGRPVVFSQVEGSEELVAHSRQQQCFPAGDGDAMSSLVQRLLADGALCDQLGSDNQTRMKTEFTIPAMVDAYFSHYRRLLEQS